jgi:hypothetical protein
LELIQVDGRYLEFDLEVYVSFMGGENERRIKSEGGKVRH